MSAPAATVRPPFWRNPWRRPVGLEVITWTYLAWSLVPVLIAVAFSFNAGRNPGAWQGFSFRWWFTDPTGSVWHSPELHQALIQTLRLALLSTIVAVPIGVAFGIGVDRWRGRLSGAFNFQMLLSFVMPELVLGVALLLVVEYLIHQIALGTTAQVLGLVTFQMSYPVILVRARLASIGYHYEEAAMDLGASPLTALRKVLLPLLYPAIFASAVLVFADCIDDFVIVRYLSSDASTEPMSVKIYNSVRSAPTPALNALATCMLVASLLAVVLGFLAYRKMTAGERSGGDAQLLSDIAVQL